MTMIRTSGLHFQKIDLHVHTAASHCYAGDKSSCPSDIVHAALSKGLAAIAITDHNTADGIDAVREAAKGHLLRVFPGVEITVGDARIHVIAILDPDAPSKHVVELLQRLKLKGECGAEGTYACCTVEHAIDCITREAGGLAVLAHSDSSNGVFDEMKGAPRIGVVQNPRLLAVEAKDLPGLRKFLGGADPNYLRKLAVYRASDNPAPSGNGNHSPEGVGSAFSYFKVDDHISLESLRQCFIDPDVRIRQEDEYKPGFPPHIVSMTVDSGLFESESLEFHHGLNCILGAKGSGKSMLIELLRFGLDQLPTIPSILEDHMGKLEKRLGLYGQVKIRFVDETGKQQEVARKFDPSAGNPVESIEFVRPDRVLRAMFLSQNEIVKIAEDERRQLQFIDRFFDISYYQDTIVTLENELRAWDEELAQCITAYIQTTKIDADLSEMKKEEGELSQRLSAEVITRYRAAEAKYGAMQRHCQHAGMLVERLQKEARDWSAESPLKIASDLANDPAMKRMAKIEATMLSSVADLRQSIVDTAIEAHTALVAEANTYRATFAAIQSEYESYVKTSGGDEKLFETKRKQVIQRMQALTAQKDTVQPLVNRFVEVRDQRADKLNSLFGVYAECHKERVDRCKAFEANSGGRLEVIVHEASNSAVFRKELLGMKRGSYMADKEVAQLCDSAPPRETIWAMIAYAAGKDKLLRDLARAAGLQFAQLKTLADFLLDRYKLVDLLRLQYENVPEDRPEIRLIHSDGRKILLKNASVGQKCTAMLVMALCDETMPVIIDQPEDSLDNRTVWEDVCAKLREHKEHRQFILATHNSSLAVASDTDKYAIVEEVDADHARIALSGSVDVAEIKEEVIKYLEGGRETYLTKYAKYAAEGGS